MDDLTAPAAESVPELAVFAIVRNLLLIIDKNWLLTRDLLQRGVSGLPDLLSNKELRAQRMKPRAADVRMVTPL
ncbi:hypothetical protein SH449x_004540 [Pirellulaceae bacterium SH449]